eukprot:TRINITY_DN9339_c0_g1_i7.p1 TRINITY_DN9339_c0_g1~~TRINITY_DN9339_c0_g1_i7.p1  ORF type:complete len:678 (-),score=233.56 TRINITY_DN9339_c0_g1_i7:92-2125(-)
MQNKLEESKVQYPKADAFIEHLLKLIKREHEEEVKGAADHKKSYTQSQLENMGLAITNLLWTEFSEQSADKGLLKFKRSEQHESSKKSSSQIKKGDKVQILRENPTFSGKVLAAGRIHEISSEVIVITVEGGQINAAKAIPEHFDVHHTRFSIYVKDTDYTYQCCKKALKSVVPVTGASLYLYKVLLEIEKPRIHQIFPYPRIDELNQVQEMAVLRALDAVDIYLMHGPPGTGKTKTLARYVVEEVNRGSKVIACCPSNVAVDNLLRELHYIKENMEICRLGINEKMHDDATEFSLEAQVASRNTTHIVYATKKIIEGSKVILGTTAGISDYQAWKHLTKLHEQGQSFVVVIDEAAQATEPTCWVPLKIASKLVLAGDHMQLPPTVKCEDIKNDLGITLFERLFNSYGNDPKYATTLVEQYRMCPTIMGWTSGEMYEGKLQAASMVKERRLMYARWAEIKRLNLPEVNMLVDKDMVMIDTARQGRKEADDAGYSKCNPGEVEIIRVLVALLAKIIPPESIGIISPYRSQVELLRRELIEKGKLKVKVSTIDGYQGREEDIIIISMVRSNSLGEIGFLGDDRRINVAITRARMQVVIVGDSDTICYRPFLRRLVDYIRVNGAIFHLNKEAPKTEETVEKEVEETKARYEEREQGYYRRNGRGRRGRTRWRPRCRRGRY